jgi:hypothetical protein
MGRSTVPPLWPRLLSLAVFLASLAAALRTALRWTDGRLIYALDDAYIHMAVAKNLIQTWKLPNGTDLPPPPK